MLLENAGLLAKARRLRGPEAEAADGDAEGVEILLGQSARRRGQKADCARKRAIKGFHQILPNVGFAPILEG